MVFDLDTATKLAGLMAGLAGVWKLIAHPLLRVVHEFDGLREAVGDIRKEVKPNGGSSLKDSITRIETSVGRLEELQAARFDGDDVAVFEADREGRLVWVNKAYVRLCGRERSELIGNGWKNVVHGDEREDVYSEWMSAVRDGREFEMDYRWVHINGSVLAVHGTAVRISTGFLGFVRKRATGQEVRQ